MGGYTERKRRQSLAYGRAAAKLIRRHPGEFVELYEAERKAIGVWPDLPRGGFHPRRRNDGQSPADMAGAGDVSV